MKRHIILLLLLQCSLLKAQFSSFTPYLASPYADPLDLNRRLDSAYLPGPDYVIQRYYYDSGAWKKNEHFLVETDDYLLKKFSHYIDNITSNTWFDLDIKLYQYDLDKLASINYSARRAADGIEQPIGIDSFFYNGQHPSSFTSWDFYISSEEYMKRQSTGYVYDSAGKYIGIDGLDLLDGVLYTGYYRIDSLSTNGKPLKLTEFCIQGNVKTDQMSTLFRYDFTGRLTSAIRILLYNVNSPRLIDSVNYYYTGLKQYPDSVLFFDPNITGPSKCSAKLVYTYDAKGKVSEVLLSYIINQNIVSPKTKEVYTTKGSVGINASDNSFLKNILIYPNPCHSNIWIESINNIPITRCRIIDVQGKEWISKVEDDIQLINIEFLDEGLYCLQVEYDNGERAVSWFMKKE